MLILEVIIKSKTGTKNLNKVDYLYLKKQFKNQNAFSSYEAASESNVLIGTMSTMLREFFLQKNFSMQLYFKLCLLFSNKINKLYKL